MTLNKQEWTVVLDTLSSRHKWLLNQCKEKPDNANQDQFRKSAALLESAIKKLSETSNSTEGALNPKMEAFYEHLHSDKTTSTDKTPLSVSELHTLIVEDSADSSYLLKSVLEDLGVEKMDLAMNGQEAVEKIQNADPPYRLILCDWNMPKMTGLEVHQRICQKTNMENTHFMLVTAVNEAERIKEAIKQGISDYIIKPVDIDILEEKLKKAFGEQIFAKTV